MWRRSWDLITDISLEIFRLQQLAENPQVGRLKLTLTRISDISKPAVSGAALRGTSKGKPPDRTGQTQRGPSFLTILLNVKTEATVWKE